MLPENVNFEKFELLSLQVRGKGNWSVKILYNNADFLLQTTVLTLPFDMNAYKYPGQESEKFSINVTVDPLNNETKSLDSVIKNVDQNVQLFIKELNQIDETKLTYFSPLKVPDNPKYLPSLRCKMVSNTTRFKFNFFINNVVRTPTIELMREKLIKGAKVELILRLNPIWKMGVKYGVSYQIMGLNLLDTNVRFNRNLGMYKYVNNKDSKENLRPKPKPKDVPKLGFVPTE